MFYSRGFDPGLNLLLTIVPEPQGRRFLLAASAIVDRRPLGRFYFGLNALKLSLQTGHV